MGLAEESRTPRLSTSGTIPPSRLLLPMKYTFLPNPGAPGRPEPELIQLLHAVDQHGGVPRRARGDGGGGGGRGAVVPQEP
jgi:hypothetical protein